jgi:hypothetical protein
VTAQQLLDRARAEGSAHYERMNGEVVVTWEPRQRLYDVGTRSRSIVRGTRSEVLPFLVGVLSDPSVAVDQSPIVADNMSAAGVMGGGR